jgi:hypothetical protein
MIQPVPGSLHRAYAILPVLIGTILRCFHRKHLLLALVLEDNLLAPGQWGRLLAPIVEETASPMLLYLSPVIPHGIHAVKHGNSSQ